jgi:hypothetical protein
MKMGCKHTKKYKKFLINLSGEKLTKPNSEIFFITFGIHAEETWKNLVKFCIIYANLKAN